MYFIYYFIQNTLSEKIMKCKNNIIDVFLPKNYPNSVTKQYSRYAILNAIGMAASTSNGVLSTQSLLYIIIL